MKRIFFALFLLCFGATTNAQTAAAYTFVALPSPFASIAGTGTPVPALSTDDATVASIPIGFSFTYASTLYLTLSACSNGWLSLTGSPSTAFGNISGSIDGPGWIMPFWDNLDGSLGTAYYQTTGSAPSRVFTFEWNNFRSATGTGSGTFQVKFYESINLIDFHYGPTTISGTDATIGISNDNISDWQTLGDATAAPPVLAAPAFETAVANAPPDGLLYRWTPSSCPVAPITGATSVCTGGFALVSSATAGCTWSSSTPSVATIAAGTGAISAITAGTTVLSYISPLGCYATRVFTVTPTPPITGTLSLCTGVPETFTHPSPIGTWSSSNITVATVGAATGIVTGVAAGTARITYAMPGGCKSTVTVNVSLSPEPITGTFAICQGSTTTLSTVSTGGTWSSSFSTIASIDASGGLTGILGGITTISYTLPSGCSSTAPVTVNPLPAPITGGTSLCVLGTLPLSSTTTGGTWSSTTPSVATVDASGLVTAGAIAGSSVISYILASGCFRVTTVNVVVVVSPIIGPSVVCRNQSQTYTNATSIGVWSSSDPTIATIDAAGVLVPLMAGTTIVSYTLGSGCFTIKTVTVNPNDNIAGVATVCQGLTTTMSNPLAGGTWSSSAASIFTVSPATGVVTGVSGGTANLSYTNTYGCITTTVVTVSSTPAAISGSLLICVAANTTLSSSPAGGTWSSSNTAVATIGASTGIAAGVTGGTATITYTSIPGCIRTAIISVSPLPAAMTGVMVLCPSTTSLLSHVVPGGTWTSSAPTIATIGASTGILTGISIAGGTATITYLPPSSGCATTSVVTVSPAPVISTPGSTAICVGANTTFGSSQTGSTWTSSNTAVATAGAASGVITGVSGGTATITCFGSNGCTSTVVATVNTNPTAITGTATVCVGANTALASSPAGGIWSSSNTGTATVAFGGIVTGVAANTVTISYTLGSGCYSTRTVTVNAIPSAIGGTTTVCEGLTTTLTSSAGGTWTSSNTTVATIGSLSGIATGNAAGTTNISYILPTGCFRTRVLTVNAVPAVIGGGATVCPGTNTTLTNSTSGGIWSSSFPAIASVVAGTGFVTGGVPGTTTITYTLITGCVATKIVTVMPAPVALITPIGDTVLCPGDFVSLTSSAATGVTYAWFAGGVIIPGAVAPTYLASTAGSYQVRISIGAGCSTLSPAMLVTVVPAVATITVPGGTTTTCSGTAVSLNANPGPGLTYQWELAGAAIPGATASTYNALTGGNYTVRVTNSAGCWAVSAPVTITVLPAPANVVTASGPLTFCIGSDVTLTAAAGTGYTYQWHNTAGLIPGATSISYTTTTPGSYYVVVSNATGCSTTTANSVVVVNPMPDVSITPSGLLVFCAGGNVVLSAAAGFGYQWYRSGTAISGATNISYNAALAGGYRVRVTNLTTGCTDMTHADTVVKVVATPVINPLTPAKFCWGGSSLLATSVSSYGAAINYQWYFNGIVIPGATNGAYSANTGGNFSCSISVPASCTVATLPVVVTQVPLPDPPITFNGSLFKTANFFVTYQWYKNLVAIPGATTNSTPATSDGQYKVAVTDTNGCQSMSAVYVLTGWKGTPPTGVADVNNPEVTIFPNPASNTVHIESMHAVHAVIATIDGQVALDIVKAKDIDISKLADGIYIVTLYDDEKTHLKTQRLVKRSE